jgi:hypothetical protein
MGERENILLIRIKSIGDILFALPAVHVVRENFPHAKLNFLVSREFAPLVRGFSEIDEIIPFDRAIYRSGNLKAATSSTFQLLRDLRRKKISRVIDFQGYGETEFFSARRSVGAMYIIRFADGLTRTPHGVTKKPIPRNGTSLCYDNAACASATFAMNLFCLPTRWKKAGDFSRRTIWTKTSRHCSSNPSRAIRRKTGRWEIS